MRFCFYSEYKDLKGGYTTLILTLITELHRQGQEVLLINYKSGLIAHELEKAGVNITIIDKDELSKVNVGQYLISSDILIVPRFYEFLKVFFDINPKVIYYDINDFICRISEYKFGIRLSFLGKRLVKKLLFRSSLIFMDDTGPNNLEREFGIKVKEPIFLPVPIPGEPENVYLNVKRNLDQGINIAYIGRSVDWKMYPLKKIIEDCLSVEGKINFHIVVDSISVFGNFIVPEKYENERISFQLYENLLPSEIHAFLESNVDIYFGMGTTAIQAASIGIPTILMDFSTKPLPENYSYRWFSDTESYCLGKNIEVVSIPKGKSMKTMLNLVRNDKSRVLISKNAFQYVISHHAASKVAHDLKTYGRNCKFRLKEAKNLNPYYFKIHSAIKGISDFMIKNNQRDET